MRSDTPDISTASARGPDHRPAPRDPARDPSAAPDEHTLIQPIDLGRIDYRTAYDLQCEHRDAVLADRDAETAPTAVGRLLLLEHDPPVITVSKRRGARDHLVATPEQLQAAGVVVEETDRGGDITYHGLGQLVAYPIIDLNRLGLNLHGYMRFLEEIVIDVCNQFGVHAHRDVCATGVWVGGEYESEAQKTECPGPAGGSKICAMGVRIRKWVTMHGLALNVRTNLDHFNLIVPCGLIGRPVTSLQNELGDAAPTIEEAKSALIDAFQRRAAALVDAD